MGQVDIHIKKSARRKRSIQLRAVSKGVIELRIPERYSVEMLAELLSSHVKFLEKSQLMSHSIVPGLLGNNTPVFFFGEHYTLTIVNDQSIGNTARVNTETKTITIHSKKNRILRASFYSALSHYLLVYLQSRASILATQMGNLEYKKIRTKLVRSLWGSCSRSGNLSFNKRLIHYPNSVIDYVVIHELAHLVHRNHSAHYWEFVSMYCPSYRDHRLTLKKNMFG